MITSILLAVYAVSFSLSAPGRVKWEKRILSRTLPFLIHPLISVEGLKRVNENKKNVQSCCSTYFLYSHHWDDFLQHIWNLLQEAREDEENHDVIHSKAQAGLEKLANGSNHIRHLKLFRICLVSNCFMSRYETFGSLCDMWTCLTRSGAFKV